jgi:formamidopyrimidine-DNA glycosylase
MPELPEVETIRRQIAPAVTQQRILAVRVSRARAVRAHRTPEEFIRRVSGRTILDARRRGKVLLLPLDDGDSLLVRLGMSGQLTVADPATPRAAHTHVVLSLANGQELRYIDPRTFGQVAVVHGHDPERMIELGHYGYEPLGDASFTPDALAALMAGKRALVQAVLMDQTKVVGIGKIYADESCFLAGIDPRRTSDTLTRAEIQRLHTAIRDVLERAINARGTSGQDGAYRDARGSLGAFQLQLHVYQRVDQPCRICGTPVEYRPFQGRRMHFCPSCQK